MCLESIRSTQRETEGRDNSHHHEHQATKTRPLLFDQELHLYFQVSSAVYIYEVALPYSTLYS